MKPAEEEKSASATAQEKLLSRLKFKPLKDILIFVVLALLIVILSLCAFYLKPTSDNTHVEIKYNNTLLYDKNDSAKSTEISFPTSGEKKVTFTKEDGSLYLGEGNEFDFEGDSITFTLYSDKSIQVLESEVSCSDKTCAHFGRVYTTYTPVVCLPNHMQAMIVADSLPEYDN